ncbi:MAG TPA: DUF4124 domain-containing protein [Rhodanobacteraceae bacterium]
MSLRPLVVASILGLSLACAAGMANAQQIYKWKDANGVTHFSQTPPATGTHYSKMHLSSAPEISSNPPPANAGDSAQSDSSTDNRARASSGTQPDTPSNRAQLCKQLNSNITLLQSKQPVVAAGSSGKQEVMSDNAREQQLATARAQQAQYCSAKGT